MKPYKNKERNILLDKLVDYVNRYLKLRTQGGRREEFTHCEETLQYIFTRMEKNRSGGASNTPEKANEE